MGGKAICRGLNIVANNKSHLYLPLRRNVEKLCMKVVVSNLSSDPYWGKEKTLNPTPQPIVIYEGIFAGKLRHLRIFSLGSALLSAFGLPMAMTISSGAVPVVGQIAIIGTAVAISVSSTVFLQLVTAPYVAKLIEIPPLEGVEVDFEDRVFKATRIDMFGRFITNEFQMKDVIKDEEHPFASVIIKGHYHYIFGGEMDASLRHRLTSEI
jgi:hypothetical protein